MSGLKIPKAQRAKPESETTIQKRVVKILAYMLRPGVIMFHVPNGGSRRRVEAAILKGMGTLPGVADLVFLHEGRAYCMELKRPGEGAQSDEQLEFERRCSATGVPYRVVTSHEEAIECARDWFLIRPTLG